MSEPADAKPKRGSKPTQPKAAPEPAKATKHKKWVKDLEAARLTRLFGRAEADVAKALKKAGVRHTIEELALPAPAKNQQVVLYKSEGKLVGYAVGATSAPAQKPAAQKPAAKKPAAEKPAAEKPAKRNKS